MYPLTYLRCIKLATVRVAPSKSASICPCHWSALAKLSAGNKCVSLCISCLYCKHVCLHATGWASLLHHCVAVKNDDYMRWHKYCSYTYMFYYIDHTHSTLCADRWSTFQKLKHAYCKINATSEGNSFSICQIKRNDSKWMTDLHTD